jgi:hypothetical protein
MQGCRKFKGCRSLLTWPFIGKLSRSISDGTISFSIQPFLGKNLYFLKKPYSLRVTMEGMLLHGYLFRQKTHSMFLPTHYRIFRTPFNPDLNPNKTCTAVKSAVSPDDEVCTQLIVMTCFDLHRDKVKVTCVSGAEGRSHNLHDTSGKNMIIIRNGE